MTRFITQLPKRLLKRFKRTLCYTSYSITGCHFPDDLREVVGNEAPLCLDIGAHWGETIGEFRKIFTDPVIHSFEPSLANYEKLKKLERPGRIIVHHAGVGAEDGTLNLRLFADSVLNSFLPIDPAGPQGGQKECATETVRVVTLDTFLREKDINRVDLLKIDTQGYELQVLQGGSASLEAGVVKAVLLEVNFSSIYTGQSPIFEIFSLLQGHGLDFVDFYQKARIGHALSWCNALFVRGQVKEG